MSTPKILGWGLLKVVPCCNIKMKKQLFCKVLPSFSNIGWQVVFWPFSSCIPDLSRKGKWCILRWWWGVGWREAEGKPQLLAKPWLVSIHTVFQKHGLSWQNFAFYWNKRNTGPKSQKSSKPGLSFTQIFHLHSFLGLCSLQGKDAWRLGTSIIDGCL